MTVTLTDTGLVITDLVVTRREVLDLFAAAPEGERERLAREAFEVGVFCLERARNGSDLEFVRRHIEGLLAAVTTAVDAIPATTEQRLLERIGTADGQVLAPVHGLVRQVERGVQQQLHEVRELLANEVDPTRDSSTIARALKKLGDLLDEGRKDSVQARVHESLSKVTAEDGMLAQSVRAVVAESVRPLADEVTRLAHIVTGQEAAAEALAHTTARGLTFEEHVVEAVQLWGGPLGVEVQHCGVDNQPGDVLVRFGADSIVGSPLSIVIECRDRNDPSGRKPISEAMQRAMSTRQATRGIYLSRSSKGLAKELGDWGEGTVATGSWVATTDEFLEIALRFALVMERVERVRSSSHAVDGAFLLAQAGRVRDALRRITTINARAGDVRSSADAIVQEATRLRSDISDALQLIEDGLAPTIVGAECPEAA